MDFSLLNENQKKAVKILEGPMLILAGAGSGKTRTIAFKIAYLIEKGIPPENILALTFTNKAALEMKKRIESLISKKISLGFCGTFHSLGAKILRENHKVVKEYFSRDKNFTIFDESDSLSLLKKIVKELDLPSENFPPSKVLSYINFAKTHLLDENDFSNSATEFFEREVAKIYRKYEEKLKEINAFDFDDLIFRPVQLFLKNKEILEKYQERFRYILIDEYQDTNYSQYLLVKLLASKYKNICAVGDDQQAIYGFRFADFRNILNFEKDFEGAKVIFLEENYRSHQKILDAANALISFNRYQKPKFLFSRKKEGPKPKVIYLSDETEEANFVAQKISEYLEKGVPKKEIAVFFRISALSRTIENALIFYQIPYQVVGGLKFFERKEIKDILSYLRLILNPNDFLSLERVINLPPRGIGKKALEKILKKDKKILEKKEVKEFFSFLKKAQKFASSHSLSSLIEFILKESGYEKFLWEKEKEPEIRLENIKELLSYAKSFENLPPQKALEAFLESVSLFQEQDELLHQKDAVNLMTIHSAKGLEFEIVFLIGMEQGIFPHWKSLRSEEELEEERRLCYVALTRAKNKLYLLTTEKRLLFGNLILNEPSQFLGEIPNELVIFEDRRSYL